jgi:SPP1 gp7 family putative phage head morphogenesis protein
MFINYKTALDQIRVELSKIYEKYAKSGALTYAEMSKFNRLDKLNTQLSDILGPTLSANGRLVENLRRVQYQESFYRHAYAIDQSAGVSLRWGLLNPKTVEAAVNAPAWRALKDIAVKTWKRDTFVKLDRTITQGLIQGFSYDKMAKAIKEDVAEKSASNAQRIARTEAHRATVQGQLDTYEEAEELGVKVQRVWDATLDKATRPEHGELDGQIADEEGMFHTAVGLVEGPGLSGEPSFDINCRCSVRPQIEGYEPKVRRIRDEGVQPYKTYSEWAKDKGIKVKK